MLSTVPSRRLADYLAGNHTFELSENEFANFRRLMVFDQDLHPRLVFVGCTHRDDIRIRPFGALTQNRVLDRIVACLSSIVRIDRSSIDIVQRPRGLCSIDLNDLQLLRIRNDVGDRRLEPHSVRQLEHTLVRQQQQDAAAIGRIVGDRQRSTIRNGVPRLMLLRVNAGWEVDRVGRPLNLVAAVGFLVVKIRLALASALDLAQYFIVLQFAREFRGIKIRCLAAV